MWSALLGVEHVLTYRQTSTVGHRPGYREVVFGSFHDHRYLGYTWPRFDNAGRVYSARVSFGGGGCSMATGSAR